MKLAIVTTSYPRHEGDACGHFVATEAKALLATGQDVVVIAPGRSGAVLPAGADEPRRIVVAAGDAFGWPGALSRLRRRPWRLAGAARFVAGARRALRREAPDRVIAHFLLPCGWPIGTAAPNAELEVVSHGSDARLLCRLPGRTHIVRTLLDAGARFRFASAELRERVVAFAPDVASRSRVAPSPLDVSAAPPRVEARRRLHLSDDEQLAVVASRLLASKRIDVALAAAKRRARRVVVVGDGPLAGPLRARFPDVDFVGRLERPLALTWIAAADLVVSASLEEGAPTVVREARALGVPVLAAPAGDLAVWAASDDGIELLV